MRRGWLKQHTQGPRGPRCLSMLWRPATASKLAASCVLHRKPATAAARVSCYKLYPVALLLAIAELANICHQHGVPLLVDEAHGGHLSPMAKDLQHSKHAAVQVTEASQPTGSLGVPTASTGQQQQQTHHAEGTGSGDSISSSAAPLSAVDAGADVVMHSTHKVLTAMTQAAMLHLCSDALVAPSKISKALQVRQQGI